jgi:acyl-CoA thioesterase
MPLQNTLKFPLGKFPLADMLGIKTLAYSVGHSTLALQVGTKHLNPRGLVHGSVPFALADTGMALALYASRDEHYHNTEEWFATLEIKITYLQPVHTGRLVCDTNVIREGRRFAMLESEISNDDILIAKASGTFAFASIPK